MGAVDGHPPRLGDLVRVARTDHVETGDRAQSREVLDRLVGGAVLAEPDGVVGEDVDHRELHQRREPDGGLRVVGEGEVGGPQGPQLGQREAVGDRRGLVLPDPEVELAAQALPRLEVGRPFELEPHRGRVGEIRRAGEHPRIPSATAFSTAFDALRVAMSPSLGSKLGISASHPSGSSRRCISSTCDASSGASARYSSNSCSHSSRSRCRGRRSRRRSARTRRRGRGTGRPRATRRRASSRGPPPPRAARRALSRCPGDAAPRSRCGCRR